MIDKILRWLREGIGDKATIAFAAGAVMGVVSGAAASFIYWQHSTNSEISEKTKEAVRWEAKYEEAEKHLAKLEAEFEGKNDRIRSLETEIDKFEENEVASQCDYIRTRIGERKGDIARLDAEISIHSPMMWKSIGGETTASQLYTEEEPYSEHRRLQQQKDKMISSIEELEIRLDNCR